MKLIYRAVSPDGIMSSGLIDAKDPHDAAAYLRKQHLIPIKIDVQKQTNVMSFLPSSKKMTQKDLLFFTEQLASMLQSGLTLVQSLHVLRNQIKKESMTELLDHVISDIEEGETFSDSLLRYPQVFSPIYISLIKAAEASGLLDKVLLRLSENIEKSQKLKSTIRGALLYPAIVFTLMVAVIGVIMIFVIPTLAKYYASLNAKLPALTQALITVSNFSVHAWWLVIIVIVGIVYGVRKWYATPPGKVFVDNLILKVPIIGPIITESVLTEFSRTFGLLIGTGALIVDSLQKTGDVLGNIHFQDATKSIATRVEKGISIGDAMSYTKRFPSLLVEMVKIGEQTGKLDESLTRASEYFERETEKAVKTMTTALEPLIMVVLGVSVGIILVAVLMPIFNLSNLVQ